MFGSDSCSARPRKVLWLFRSYLPHDIRVLWVKQWAFGKWEAELECKHCGERRNPFGLTDGELLWAGLPLEEIRDTCVREWDTWTPNTPTRSDR